MNDNEIKNMKFFEKIFKFDKSVNIPKVYKEFSTKRLITMSWLEGNPILDYKDKEKKIRNNIAINMFKTWYKPFYEYGIHNDEAEKFAKDQNMDFVSNRCIKQEYQRLFQKSNPVFPVLKS